MDFTEGIHIFNATDAEGGDGKVVAVVAGAEPPVPEDAVTLGVGGQTDNTKDWDFYTIDGQTFKVPSGYHVIITPSGEPKTIFTSGLKANFDSTVLFGLLGPRRAFAGENYYVGKFPPLKMPDEVSWVNDITKRVSERRPELKPFIRSTR